MSSTTLAVEFDDRIYHSAESSATELQNLRQALFEMRGMTPCFSFENFKIEHDILFFKARRPRPSSRSDHRELAIRYRDLAEGHSQHISDQIKSEVWPLLNIVPTSTQLHCEPRSFSDVLNLEENGNLPHLLSEELEEVTNPTRHKRTPRTSSRSLPLIYAAVSIFHVVKGEVFRDLTLPPTLFDNNFGIFLVPDETPFAHTCIFLIIKNLQLYLWQEIKYVKGLARATVLESLRQDQNLNPTISAQEVRVASAMISIRIVDFVQTCSICLDPLDAVMSSSSSNAHPEQVVLLLCSHRFHLRCIKRHILHSGTGVTCPYCRRKIPEAYWYI